MANEGDAECARRDEGGLLRRTCDGVAVRFADEAPELLQFSRPGGVRRGVGCGHVLKKLDVALHLCDAGCRRPGTADVACGIVQGWRCSSV